MKKPIIFLILSSLSLLHAPLMSMEPDKPKSCGEKGAIYLITQFERPLYYCFMPKTCKFTPFTSEDYALALTLFAKKNIILDNTRLIDLEQDAHLQEVAAKAKLGGLCLYLAKKESSSICYDAYTAHSIAQFMGGAIQHAIAIPEAVYNNQADEQTSRSINGMIEREIARITQAYSPDDREIKQFWRNCGWTAYSLAALVGCYFEPFSLVATAPGGLLLESIVRESVEIADESALDTKAAELAETTEHLMATLTASTHALNAEKEKQHAETKHKNDDYPVSLSLRAQRILNLLITQEQLKKNE